MTNHECRFCMSEFAYKYGHMLCKNGHFTCEPCYTTWKSGGAFICPWCFELEIKNEQTWIDKCTVLSNQLDESIQKNRILTHKLYFMQYSNKNLNDMINYLRIGEERIYLPIVLGLNVYKVMDILNFYYGRPDYPIVKYVTTQVKQSRLTMTVVILQKTRRLIHLLEKLEKGPVNIYYEGPNGPYLKVVKYKTFKN